MQGPIPGAPGTAGRKGPRPLGRPFRPISPAYYYPCPRRREWQMGHPPPTQGPQKVRHEGPALFWNTPPAQCTHGMGNSDFRPCPEPSFAPKGPKGNNEHCGYPTR